MIKVYAVNCAPLAHDDNTMSKSLSRIGSARAAQASRNRRLQKRTQSIAAGLLLTHLFGIDGQPPQLIHGSHDKPYLIDNRAFFNLSHTEDWVICAVANSEIGVDAQVHTAYKEKVAARCFTSSENAWLDDDRDARFSRLWTYKEAYAKLTGLGLVLPLSSFTVPTPPDGWDDQNHVCWKEYTLSGDPAVHITVCCDTQDDFAPIQILQVSDLL